MLHCGKILISGCLAGLSCSYDGQIKSEKSTVFREIFGKAEKLGYSFIPFCPEQAGGLATPRKPAELQTNAENILENRGKIVSISKTDVTENFIKGAKETKKVCELFSVSGVILKEKSPSCGKRKVYSGKFDGNLIDGMGLTCFLLSKCGFQIFSDEEFLTYWDNEGEEVFQKLFPKP
ncbi:MAG: DUF523 domain-containing protein [Candidatus Riflebacteria bacterium]|nr:DUF523 domain-containing protein [Candidatus Riflebacteria bacterium]